MTKIEIKTILVIFSILLSAFLFTLYGYHTGQLDYQICEKKGGEICVYR
jgi:hypothetical protein